MAKDNNRDEKSAHDAAEQKFAQEAELLAEERRQIETLRAEQEAEGQRLAAERAELEKQKAELLAAQTPAAVELPADANPVPKSKHVIMHVLRKFRFQYPLVTRGELITPGAERWFEKGDNLLDPDDPQDAFVLNHSWIKNDLADGRIEHPQSTMDRLAAMAQEAKHKASTTRAAIQQAENALLQHASFTHKNEAAADAFLREMNTPINQRHLI